MVSRLCHVLSRNVPIFLILSFITSQYYSPTRNRWLFCHLFIPDWEIIVSCYLQILLHFISSLCYLQQSHYSPRKLELGKTFWLYRWRNWESKQMTCPVFCIYLVEMGLEVAGLGFTVTPESKSPPLRSFFTAFLVEGDGKKMNNTRKIQKLWSLLKVKQIKTLTNPSTWTKHSRVQLKTERCSPNK